MLEKEEVIHVAELARIELTPEEVESFQQELSSILDFFRELSELDTDRVEAIGHSTGRADVARADVVREAPQAEKERIKKNFPEEQDGYLKVRSVL